MNDRLGKVYDEKFYNIHEKGMSKSASIILGLLYEYYNPQRIIDIGCGQGAWLAVAETLGAKKLKGLDGNWVKKESLLSKNIDFTPVDFDNAMPTLSEKFDLCISLEVAEHISQANAKKFIDLLCKSSETVLFSAAVKGQGGPNHINEQWQSYWIDLFKSNGYECLDVFRGRLWNNPSVELWYKQNTFLFSGSSNSSLNLEVLRNACKPISDIAHPHLIEAYTHSRENPSLQTCFDTIRCYVKNRFQG